MLRFLFAIFTLITFSSCACNSSSYSPAAHASWQAYLRLSPLSNPTPLFELGPSAHRIRGLGADLGDPLINDHLRRVADWAAATPGVIARAEAASIEARDSILQYEKPARILGGAIAEHTADKDASFPERKLRGYAGDGAAGLITHLMAEWSASSAKSRILNAHFAELKILSFNERAICLRMCYPLSPLLAQRCQEIEQAEMRSSGRPRSGGFRGRPFIHINLR